MALADDDAQNCPSAFWIVQRLDSLGSNHAILCPPESCCSALYGPPKCMQTIYTKLASYRLTKSGLGTAALKGNFMALAARARPLYMLITVHGCGLMLLRLQRLILPYKGRSR